MSAIWILIGFSILVAGGFLVLFIWAVKSGQYDDRYTPSVRILFEDEKKIRGIKQSSEFIDKGSGDHGDANNQV